MALADPQPLDRTPPMAAALRLWPTLPAPWLLAAGPGWLALAKPSEVPCAPDPWHRAADAGELLRRLAAMQGVGDGEHGRQATYQLIGAAIGGRGRAHAGDDTAASGALLLATNPEVAQGLSGALAAGESTALWLAGVQGWPAVGSPADAALRAGLAAEGVAVALRGQRGPRTLIELRTNASPGADLVQLLRRRGVIVADSAAGRAAAAHGGGGDDGEGDDVRAGVVAEARRRLWHRLELRVGPELAASKAPPIFASWLQGEPEPEVDRLARALRRRHGLAHSGRCDALRLYDDESSLVLEAYGDDLVVAVYDALPDAEVGPGLAAAGAAAPDAEAFTAALQRQRQRALALADRLGFRTVWLKLRPRQANRVVDAVAAGLVPATPLRDGDDGFRLPGGPGRRLIGEDGAQYVVDLADGLQTGIFLDQRDNRRRLRAEAAGRTLLNTFAYTCAFQVAAAVGGARRSVSIDASARALERGRANLALNGVDDAERHATWRGDVFAWLPRLQRRGERFDLLVLDPPTYARVGKRRFSAGRDYADLVALAAPLLAPGGLLLATINHAKIDRRRFEAMVREGCRRAGRAILGLQHQTPAIDHPGGRMKSAWLRLG